MEELELIGEEEEEVKPCSVENLCRKEKRKALKKIKRKQLRKELALKRLQEEEVRLNDPEEQRRIQLMELEEEERSERERKLFEERERAWMEAMELKKKKMAEEEEEEQQRRALEEESTPREAENENEFNEEDGWEYIEGPAEIIWKGEEIILKKKLIKVPKKSVEPEKSFEDAHRPTSNPLPPQSEAFTDYKNTPISTKQVIEDVASQVPNFGTEQDKSHCPFHLKTGACRFGQRCSRIHFYPEKSCTLLIKNMYNGPGLAWEQDEGLEFTDEEVERCYEEFYDDVHTEFLKYGEIVNFKVSCIWYLVCMVYVCKNGSFHLRGNLYVHYKSVDSAVLAYNANNGRFYAGKQIICEFINVTRWKIAICGEFMKTRYKTCSHGTACNFIHCFRNPGGDYEWADSDKSPPRYWLKKMTSLFGYLDEYENETHSELEHWNKFGKSSKSMTIDVDSYRSRRSKSRSLDHGSRRSDNNENDYRWIRHSRREKVHEKQQSLDKEEYEKKKYDQQKKNRSNDTDSDESVDKFGERSKDRNRSREKEKYDRWRKNRSNDTDSDESVDEFEERSKDRDRSRRSSRRPRKQESNWKTDGRNVDRDDNKNAANETDEDWSSGDGDKDGHQHKRRKSNSRASETSRSTDVYPSNSVIKDRDTHEVSSERNKERRLTYGGKPKKHWDEVTKDSDDHLEKKSNLKTDYESKKPSAGKSSSHYFESSSRDVNTEDGYSIDSLHNDVLDERWEPSFSDRCIERFKPLDPDKEHCNEHSDKEGRWDPERSYDKFEKCRETASAMCCESGSSVSQIERSKSDVLGALNNPVHKVNKRNRRKLGSNNSYEHQKSRRKSSRHDDDQDFSDLKSEKTNSEDGYLPKSHDKEAQTWPRGGNH
ncbi:zinc finger CCCH domain-containing protein 5 isoform X1 [Cucumis sativus]|uniref:zinc finger CCCH domain-containing protein 5 isoform X1 n=1 Tax=Cucumis sativus TaxID=3659 RepID=UPI0012F4C5C7|nr:zinc finger CCCH domain-containing protein 5 isoform X1 [Cucumis sativus]